MPHTAPAILLVEDEPVIAMEIRRRLENLGFPSPCTVTSGEEALRSVAAHPPDLILMDIVLNGSMDGIDAARQILSLHSIPVIYLSGRDDTQTLERAKITEPFGYLVKPFEDRELRICIEMALYKHRVDSSVRRKEQLFSTTLSNIGDAVFSLDTKGIITVVNSAAKRMTGLSAENLIGTDFSTTVHLTDDATGETISTAQALHNSARFCKASPATVCNIHGTCTPVDLTISPIAGKNCNSEGTIIVLRDASDRKRTEQILRESLENLRTTFDQTVAALAVTAEKRDPYTAGHQQRVAQLATAIAEELTLSPHDIDGIRVAALLHDIGKIHIPSEILAKPLRLNDLEMNLIRTHPQVGHDILNGISFPWPVADIVRQHHERMNGTGYPDKLSATHILPAARILAVADVVEAMSSHRPYRAALGINFALNEIRNNKGTLYDTDVVTACLALFASGFTFDHDK